MEFLDLLVDEVAVAIVKVLAALLGMGITALFALVAPKIKTWIDLKLSADQVELLRNLAHQAVSYLEQTEYLGLTNEAKKEKAMMSLAQKCSNLGLPFDYDDIDEAIEAAVLVMKSTLPDFNILEVVSEE